MCVINTINSVFDTLTLGVLNTHSAIKCVEHSNKSVLIVTTRAHQFQCVNAHFNFYSVAQQVKTTELTRTISSCWSVNL